MSRRWTRVVAWAGALAAAVALPLLALRPPPLSGRPAAAIVIADQPPAPPRGRMLFETAGSGEPPAPTGAVPQPVGIVGRLPGDARALLRLADGSVQALAIGQQGDGWRLDAIERDRLTLRRGAERRTLVLPFANPAAAPGQ